MKKATKILIAALIFNFQFSILNSQDAEYQLIRRTYTVNNDGSLDIRFRKEIKLIRNRAFTAYADKGETFILYNPAIDELTINESYTIRPDGSRVQTPPNAFVDQLPSQCQNCGRYNGIRERAVIHTGLEYNCIVILDYTIHRKQFNIWQEQFQLTQDCPVKLYEVIVDVNDSLCGTQRATMNATVTKEGKTDKIKEISDGHTYHFKATNLEQTMVFDYTPDPLTLYPHIKVELRDPQSNSLRPTANSQKPKANAKIPEAEYLIAELHDNDKEVWASNIRKWVLDNVHLVDIPSSLINQNYASPSEVFLSNCGTPEERESLISALLNQAGIAPSPIIKPTSRTAAYSHQSSADSQQPTPINIEKSLPWQGTRMGDGYQKMSLPVEEGSIKINPARLTSDLKAPMAVTNCDEKYHYVIATPRTPKRKLVNPVEISYTKKDVGSIRISISMSEGGGIEVIRELSINVKDGIVTPKQYKAFRQLIQDWNTYNTVIIK